MIRGDDWIAGALDAIFYNITIIINHQDNEFKHTLAREINPWVYDFHHRAHRAHRERTKTI